MKLIDVSTPKFPNTFTMVDDADFEIFSKWRWAAEMGRYTFYVFRHTYPDGNHIRFALHREIMDCPLSSLVDHIDGNGLNNQRSNLRLATHSQNQINRRVQKNNKSGFTGVSWNRARKKWTAHIFGGPRKKGLGSFSLLEDALKARRNAEAAFYGEFSRANRPPAEGEA